MLAHRSSSQADLGRLTFAQVPSQPVDAVRDLPLHDRIQAVWKLHVTRDPEELGDWFYPRCACGALGLPVSSLREALAHRCYIGDAEETRVIADNFYQQRIADAHLIER